MPSQRRHKKRGEPEGGPRRRTEWFATVRGVDDLPEPGLYAKATSARRRRSRLKPKAPPSLAAGAVNWTPLGPSVIANGQATGAPAVSGCVNALAVGPDNRVYAGTANGGVWFSDDGGEHWRPLDEWLEMAPGPAVGPTPGMDATSLAVGALTVVFGADPATDTIYVGTGEPNSGGVDTPRRRTYFGIGVRVSTDGGAAFHTEAAAQFANHAIFRLVPDPGDPTRVMAATSDGLFLRPAGAAAGATWTRVTNGMPTADPITSDLVVTQTGGVTTWFAGVWGRGLFQSIDLGANWALVSDLDATAGRVALAASESDPTVVYALVQEGRLYRIQAGVVRRVFGVPTRLLGDQGDYDLVVAVDPANDRTIYLGGASVDNTAAPGGNIDLSLFKGTITGTAAANNLRFPFLNTNNPASKMRLDPTWVGRGVHADIHALAFAQRADGTHDPTVVWLGTDGGPFRSVTSGTQGSFQPRTSGIAAVECTYLAQHPTSDAVVFAGCQDNGTVRHWGDAVWEEDPEADGGGVAVDPNNPSRLARQYTSADLSTSTDGGVSWRDISLPANESDQAPFYGPIVASPAGAPVTLLVYGSSRVLVSGDWGAHWVTLPTGTAPPNLAQDRFAAHPGGNVTALAFPTPTRILATTARDVFQFDWTGAPPPAAGPGWVRTAHTAGPTGLPATRAITGVAMDDPANGSLYVSLGGGGLDHLWWFDGPAGTPGTGTGTWHAARLVAPTLDAPATSVVVDPAHPERVYVGTDVGVWQGVRSPGPNWAWTEFSDGLPEAPVHDLAIHQPARLLRAATHGRGVWEFPLDIAAGAGPAVELYLRMSPADAGRRLPGPLGPAAANGPDPTAPVMPTVPTTPPAANNPLSATMSPDIKIRRGSSAVTGAGPPFPGTALQLGATGAAVLRWQRHMARRGFTVTPSNSYNAAARNLARAFQRLRNLDPDARVGARTWNATCSYPPLPAAATPSALSHLQFVRDIDDDIEQATRLGLADAAGPNRVFIQAHNRGYVEVATAHLTAVLMVAAADAGIPQLPAGYAARVVGRDATNWLAGSGWVFADATNPYRQPARPLHVREPQIVEYTVDFSTLGLPAGTVRICLLAMVTAPTALDAFTSTERNVVTLVGTDRHAACRLVRLAPVVAIP